MKISSLVSASLLTSTALSLSPAGWRKQSIYQVMTDRFALPGGSTTTTCDNLNDYCGGTYQGLIQQLDYIQLLGFTAIWISPVVDNLVGYTADGSGYHGYWAQNIYEVNTNFGSAKDLVALSNALHSRGMYLMVDVVTNHMGYEGCGDCVDYSVFKPFNNQSYYHPFCLIDYNNITSIQQCWEGDNTVSLPDLHTENANVVSMWSAWIAQLVSNYTIDGIRIDSFQQVDQAFWTPFLAAAGGMYSVGEVFNSDPTYMCPFQEYSPGLMNYPNFYTISAAFQSTSGSIANLVAGVNEMKTTCKDTTLLGSFLENHDNPRFPSLTSDISQAKNAIGFHMLFDGIPILYQGQEQHYSGGNVPANRETIWTSGYSITAPLYTYIAQLNLIRKWVIVRDSSWLMYQATPVYSDNHTIAIRKGAIGRQTVSVFSNRGSGGCGSASLASKATGFSNNMLVTELLTCKISTTDSSGSLKVTTTNGLPNIFYPTLALPLGFICIPNLSPAQACVTSCNVNITFSETVTTTSDEHIVVVGAAAQLGAWNPSNGVALKAASSSLWTGTVSLPAGSALQYKFVKVSSNGTDTWENDPNHNFIPPATCGSKATASSTWQG